MEITRKKINFWNFQTLALLATFFLLRIASFLLKDHLITQAIIAFVLLMAFAITYFKHKNLAWLILLSELFVGGAGHFLEFFGLSFRTLLMTSFLSFYTVGAIAEKKHKEKLHIPHQLYYILAALLLYASFAAILGFENGHAPRAVFADWLPYLFFVLLLPLHNLVNKEDNQLYLLRLVTVFIIGSGIFSIFNFIIFSSGLEVIHEPYYNWFRDMATGKITDMQTGFFRIVLSEHLLIVPITLILSSLVVKKEKHRKFLWSLLILTSVTLALNLSRTYILALGIGFLASLLYFFKEIKRWLIVSSSVLCLIFGSFFLFHFFSSSFDSFGLELLNSRFGSISNPSIELSTYTRSNLLPPIFDLILTKPITGHGLGASVTFFAPISPLSSQLEQIITRQFDWGYLEILVELGLIGFLLYLMLIAKTILELNKKTKNTNNKNFYIGVLSGFVALIFINVTTPALFHIFGILFTTFALVVSIKPHSTIGDVTNLIYKIFNKNGPNGVE